MTVQRRLLRALPAIYGAMSLGATIVRADNCSGPSDCQAAPANIDWTTALGISGVLILVCWRLFSPRSGGQGRSSGAATRQSAYAAKEGAQQGYAADPHAHAEHAQPFSTTGQASAAFDAAHEAPADGAWQQSPGDYGAHPPGGHPGAALEGQQAAQGYDPQTYDASVHHQTHAPGSPVPHDAHSLGPAHDAPIEVRTVQATPDQGIGSPPPGSPGDYGRAPLGIPEAAHEAMPLGVTPPEGIQAPIPGTTGRPERAPEGKQETEEPPDRAHAVPAATGRPPGYEAPHTAGLPGTPAHDVPGVSSPPGAPAHDVPEAISSLGAPSHDVPSTTSPLDTAAHDVPEAVNQRPTAVPPPSAFSPLAAAPHSEPVPFFQDVALVGAGAGLLSGVYYTPLDAAGQRLAGPTLLGSFTTDRFGLGGGAFPLLLDTGVARYIVLDYYLYPGAPPAPPAVPPFTSDLITALAPINGVKGPARFAGFVVQEPTVQACQYGQPGTYTETIAVALLNGPPNTAYDFYVQPNTGGWPLGVTTATTNVAGNVTVFAQTAQAAPIASATAPTIVTVTAVPAGQSPAVPAYTLVASGANLIALTCTSLDSRPGAITPLGITVR